VPSFVHVEPSKGGGGGAVRPVPVHGVIQVCRYSFLAMMRSICSFVRFCDGDLVLGFRDV
jgi:hypothetical protein